MESYIWVLKAEPHEHSVVIIALIGIPGKLEVICAFSRAGCRLSYRVPNLPQFALHLFWGICYIFVHGTRSCALQDLFSCHNPGSPFDPADGRHCPSQSLMASM